jgi:fructose 1,6-bisphosphatase
MITEYAIYRVDRVWTDVEKVSFAALFLALGWVSGSAWGMIMPLLSAVFYSGPDLYAP